MVSIFVTSQKYKTLPTAFRVVSSAVISFQLSPSELKVMSDELVYKNLDLESIVAQIFKQGKKFFIYNIVSGKIYNEFELLDK